MATTLNHYETMVRNLDKYLYLDQLEQMDLIERSAPLQKAKIKATWEHLEASHPKMGRAIYEADPQHLYNKEIMEGQLE